MPCPSHPPWLDILILAKSTSYEVSHYAVFSNIPSLHLSKVQILSSAPRSRTPSVCVPPLMSETKFHTHGQQFILCHGKLNACFGCCWTTG
jgi:hypothetical protein